MTVQIITTPSGERMAVMAEADYLAMVVSIEDAEDIATIDRFEARLASGEEELLPTSFVDALLAGENKIRLWREHRGLSVKALAQMAEIAPAYLSQIETGKREGTLSTMAKLAKALNVLIDDLAG